MIASVERAHGMAHSRDRKPSAACGTMKRDVLRAESSPSARDATPELPNPVISLVHFGYFGDPKKKYRCGKSSFRAAAAVSSSKTSPPDPRPTMASGGAN